MRRCGCKASSSATSCGCAPNCASRASWYSSRPAGERHTTSSRPVTRARMPICSPRPACGTWPRRSTDRPRQGPGRAPQHRRHPRQPDDAGRRRARGQASGDAVDAARRELFPAGQLPHRRQPRRLRAGDRGGQGRSSAPASMGCSATSPTSASRHAPTFSRAGSPPAQSARSPTRAGAGPRSSGTRRPISRR